MRIVILGGSGFIGGHLVNLLRPCAEVLSVSRRLPSIAQQLPGVTYVQGDCASPTFLKEVIHPNDYIVYLAYNSVPKTSFDNPLGDVQENLPIAINLLSVLRDVRINRLVYVSSGGAVYGMVDKYLPIAEDHPTNPISPYGITKLTIEKYCQMYSSIYGIPIIIARPSNPFGPGQIPYTGQGFVATAAAKLIRAEAHTIFGEFGTVRDYLYIDDLCEALKLILILNIEAGTVFNIGSESGMNNIEVLEAIASSAGIKIKDLDINFLPTRSFDVSYNVLNSARLKALGWQPTTTIDEGMGETFAWVSSYLNRL